jgi:hypothetical protein
VLGRLRRFIAHRGFYYAEPLSFITEGLPPFVALPILCIAVIRKSLKDLV